MNSKLSAQLLIFRLTLNVLCGTFLVALSAYGQTNGPDLAISVTASPTSVQVGDTILYHCVVSNVGTQTVTGAYLYAGPDHDGTPFSDIYTSYDTSNPPPFFVDGTGFKYIHLADNSIAPGASSTLDLFYTATANGQARRLIGVHSDGDINPGNDSTVVTVSIGAPTPTPTPPPPPPHGGLSTTVFTVNGSASPAPNLADTVLRFAAQQTGTPANLIVRVQATTTPNNEGSWTDLANGSGGYMTLDKTIQQFVLNSTNYPLQNGVYFRALSSAQGYSDSISNVVGPFDLATNQAHLGPTTMYMATNGRGALMNFRVSETAPPSGLVLRIQATTTPANESSWADLNDGNSGNMYPYDDPALFYLNTKHYPSGDPVYFRAVATASGHVDSLSNVIGVTGVVSGDPPTVDVLPPLPDGVSGGPGLDPDHPFVMPPGANTLRFGSQAVVLGSRQVKSIGVIYDGGTVAQCDDSHQDGCSTGQNGQTILLTNYTTNVTGDHVIKAFATDDLGITGYADPIYIRILPPGGRVFNMTSSGDWSNANNWQDAQGSNGVPGTNDFAIVGTAIASIAQDVTAFGVSLNGGSLNGAGGSFTVTGPFSIFAGQLKNINATIAASGALMLGGDSNIPMSGSLDNYGTLAINGLGGIVPVPVADRGVSAVRARRTGDVAAPELLGGLLIAIRNFGDWIFHRPATKIPPPPPPPPNPPPVEISRTVIVSTFEQHGRLLSEHGGGLIGDGGATLIGDGGATLIGHDGASLITSDGAGIVSHDGGTLIGHDGASLIGHDGASIIARNPAGDRPANTREGSTGARFVQASGETDLTNILLVSSVTINGGSLIGSGIIGGNLTNNSGFVSPGHSAGAISIVGDYTQSAQGMLIVENGGPRPDQYDHLRVTGTANLGGALDIRDINGYTPALADTFSPLGSGSLSGAFASVSSNAQVTVGPAGLLASVDTTRPNPPTGQPLDISTRLQIQSGDNVLIAGFIIAGPAGSTKQVLIRGIGPSLANFGVPGTIADPLLELHKPDGTVVINDNWRQAPNSGDIPPGFAPSNDLESAIYTILAPGSYTAIVKGAHGETGVGLAEVYDFGTASAAKLANISTRGFVQTGDNVMIGGFIIGGGEPAKVLVRAIGPSLTQFGVPGALQATTLELHDSNGNVIGSNQGWRSTQESEIQATGIPPTNDKEAAILATLVPGSYTAIMRGKSNTTGVGLVEAYNLQ
jgi:uncharacterized protein DUF11